MYTSYCFKDHAERLINASKIICCFIVEVFNKEYNKMFNNNVFRSYIFIIIKERFSYAFYLLDITKIE